MKNEVMCRSCSAVIQDITRVSSCHGGLSTPSPESRLPGEILAAVNYSLRSIHNPIPASSCGENRVSLLISQSLEQLLQYLGVLGASSRKSWLSDEYWVLQLNWKLVSSNLPHNTKYYMLTPKESFMTSKICFSRSSGPLEAICAVSSLHKIPG